MTCFFQLYYIVFIVIPLKLYIIILLPTNRRHRKKNRNRVHVRSIDPFCVRRISVPNLIWCSFSINRITTSVSTSSRVHRFERKNPKANVVIVIFQIRLESSFRTGKIFQNRQCSVLGSFGQFRFGCEYGVSVYSLPLVVRNSTIKDA